MELYFGVPDRSRNLMSKVLSTSWSPYRGFGIYASRVGADVPPGSFSFVIGIKVISKTYELSSSS